MILLLKFEHIYAKKYYISMKISYIFHMSGFSTMLHEKAMVEWHYGKNDRGMKVGISFLDSIQKTLKCGNHVNKFHPSFT